MERDTLALITSFCSLLVAFAALGWNIYREIALRGRLKVHMAIGESHQFGQVEKKVYISVANHGPGPVQIQGFTVKPPRHANFDVRYYVVPVDWEDPLTTRLPALLSVGESANIVIKYGPDLFFAGGAAQMGITDSFGRTHWTPRRDGQLAITQFRKDFATSLNGG